jgi:hypothetical protein
MKLPGLCQVCHNCLFNDTKSKRDEEVDGQMIFIAQKSVQGLISSSDSGCTICSLLWRPLSPTQKQAVSSTKAPEDGLTMLLLCAGGSENSALGINGSWEVMATIMSDELGRVKEEQERLPLYFLLLPKQGLTLPLIARSP